MYLKIKNAIIAVLLTVMYRGWVVEGITKAKLIIICVYAFFSLFTLLELADEEYKKMRRR